jgi:response regulator RpfG family c-di-GMP phosphodiesterase
VYDLAVLDIRMPGMNDFQLCIQLREIDDRLRMCFLTAADLFHYQETYSDVIRDLGIGCFVSKPVDNEDLVRRIKTMLSYLESKN